MNEKWYSADVSEIEKKLKTNAASGLSLKAARSRVKREYGELFVTQRKPALNMLIELLADFSLIFLILCSSFALIFGEKAMGIGVLPSVAIYVSVCFLLYYRSQRMFESLERFFHPSVTVIRGGKAYLVDSRSVVIGDVVLIKSGDVLCFDARLVTSDKLCVNVRYDRTTVTECEKFAECRVGEKERDIRKMANMVHAGSVVKEGSARAIVTAVGRYTYYGAMTGGIFLERSQKIPHGLKLLKKYCSGFSFLIMLLVIPFTALSLLFAHRSVTLLTSFGAVLAIASSSMSAIACTSCRAFFEKQVKRALASTHPSVIRSPDAMDRLLSVEYVFLLDGSAVSDGTLHFERAVFAEGELSSFKNIPPACAMLGELAALYDAAESRTLTVGISSPGRYSKALGEFVEATQTDREALKIRCSVTGYVPGGISDKNDRLFYFDRDRRRSLGVCDDPNVILRCSEAVVGPDTVYVSEEEKKKIVSVCLKYVSEGKKVLVFTASNDQLSESLQGAAFVGALVFSQKRDSGFEEAIKALSAVGIKTISFVNIKGAERKVGAELCAPYISKPVSSNDFKKISRPITYEFGKISTYSELSFSEIDELISYIHSNNKKVALVSFTDIYKGLKQKADLFVSCSALQYRFTGNFEEELEALEVSDSADSLCCRQDIKLDADMVIPRPSGAVGGMMSFFCAQRATGCAYNNLMGFFRYVLCTQFVRIVMVLLPMMFGQGYIDARHSLLLGFVFDIGTLAVFSHERYGAARWWYRKQLDNEFSKPLRSNFLTVLSFAIGGAVAVLLPVLMGRLDIIGRYLCQTEYLFVSMLLLHIAALGCVIFDNMTRYGMSASVGPALFVCVVSLVFTMLCFVIDPLGALFDISRITLPYLLISLIPSLIAVLLYFVMRKKDKKQ